MNNKKLSFASLVIPAAILFLQACHTDTETSEPDPIFAEKKRPQYNQVLLNQKPNDNNYQEVNASFISDYQSRQNLQDQGMLMSKNAQENSMDSIQKLRNEAAKYNYRLVPLQDYSAPIQPVTPKEPEPRYTETKKPESDPAYEEGMASVPSDGETFEIQAGAYNSEAGAMKIVQKLENKGVANVRIDNKDGRFTIRINNEGKPFKTREEASKTLQEIIEKTQHYDIMVVKK